MITQLSNQVTSESFVVPPIPGVSPINFKHETPLNIDSLNWKTEEVLLKDKPFDVTATFTQLAAEYGFDNWEYSVITPDGYVLKVFRLRKKGQQGRGKPVFLQHGLFSDADTWCLMKQDSLAYVLANAGYDVWLGNNRGSKYSRENVFLDPTKDKAKFFDYSFFELGKYDAPSQIDFVRTETKHDKISYIGHSQGTSQMFSALAYNHGELRDKLNLFVALAPIINLANSPNTLMQSAAEYWRTLEGQARFFNAYEIQSPAFDAGLRNLCTYIPYICMHIQDFISPCTPWNDPVRAKIDADRTNSGAALKQIVHYGQTFQTGVYKQFDYGSDAKNTERYGSNIVPLIPIHEIKDVPIAYFVGKHDDLGNPIDTAWSYEKIESAFLYNLYDDMDHYSFQTGIDLKYTADVLDLLEEYNKEESTVENTLY